MSHPFALFYYSFIITNTTFSLQNYKLLRIFIIIKIFLKNLKNFVEKMGIYIIGEIKIPKNIGGNIMLFEFSMAAQLAGAIRKSL